MDFLCEDSKKIGKDISERIWHFLQAIPFTDLSEKAYSNYAKRFGLDVDIFRAFVKLEKERREGGAL